MARSPDPRWSSTWSTRCSRFEGERGYPFRILRAAKNRFGATDEIGVFEMGDAGLREVKNPSALFLNEGGERAAGAAVFAGIEGSRPVLVEFQALVAPSAYGTPRRAVVGWDQGRLAMILAVLEARCGIGFAGRDVYLNVAGGLRISEPAADLAAAAALVSSALEVALPQDCVVFGEVSLSGEVRMVSRGEMRLKEAAKLGFRRALAPLGAPRAAGLGHRRRAAGRRGEADRRGRLGVTLFDIIALLILGRLDPGRFRARRAARGGDGVRVRGGRDHRHLRAAPHRADRARRRAPRLGGHGGRPRGRFPRCPISRIRVLAAGLMRGVHNIRALGAVDRIIGAGFGLVQGPGRAWRVLLGLQPRAAARAARRPGSPRPASIPSRAVAPMRSERWRPRARRWPAASRRRSQTPFDRRSESSDSEQSGQSSYDNQAERGTRRRGGQIAVSKKPSLDPRRRRLRLECGVFGVFDVPDAAAVTALGLHALQHRGEEACGIASFDGQGFHTERHMGHVADAFAGGDLVDAAAGRERHRPHPLLHRRRQRRCATSSRCSPTWRPAAWRSPTTAT